MLSEFGLAAALPDGAGAQDPDRRGATAARGVGRAERRRGVRLADGRGAPVVESRPARAADTRAADDAARARGVRALQQPAQRGAVPDDRGSRRRRRAARGADRRRARDRCGSRPSSRSAWRSGCCARSSGSDWRPRRVCFAHDAPADRSVHERVFGRNVEFGHDFNGIVCARATSRCPIRTPIPEIARLRARRCSRRVPRASAPT